ncbi:MAG TPA: branched-chain amino acid ABC transporter permease [Solirubrobacteraceae bacterium]|jgi:branched-chain amino acid transport system permease protein
MTLFVASLVSGLTLGGTFALIALGLVLAFRATRTFNFAHGEMMLLGAFIVGYFQLRHGSTAVALLVALSATAVVGAGFYLLVLRRMTGMSHFMSIIATFGLAAILDGTMGILFPALQYTIVLPGVPTSSVHVLGALVSAASLTLAAFAIALAVIVAAIVRFTHLGLMIRAAGQDPLLASQCGIKVRRLYTGSWAIAGLLAAVAGITYGSSAIVTTSIDNLGLVAIPAMVLGGMDSVGGAVVGGILVGLMQGFVQVYLGGQYVDVLTYTILLAALLVYPQGLFGTKEIVRA